MAPPLLTCKVKKMQQGLADGETPIHSTDWAAAVAGKDVKWLFFFHWMAKTIFLATHWNLKNNEDLHLFLMFYRLFSNHLKKKKKGFKIYPTIIILPQSLLHYQSNPCLGRGIIRFDCVVCSHHRQRKSWIWGRVWSSWGLWVLINCLSTLLPHFCFAFFPYYGCK